MSFGIPESEAKVLHIYVRKVLLAALLKFAWRNSDSTLYRFVLLKTSQVNILVIIHRDDPSVANREVLDPSDLFGFILPVLEDFDFGRLSFS